MTHSIIQRTDSTLNQRNQQILVVDDIPANLKLLTEILSEAGYHARPAPSGRMALRSIAIEPPDLILLDVKMPDMDGYEVCKCLKSDEKTSRIPIIFISAMDDVEDKIRGLQEGGVDYISKPFQAAEVLARVRTHLALRTLHKELETKNSQLRQEIAERKLMETALKEYRDHLEELVYERTEDLVRINKELNQEIDERRLAEEALVRNERKFRAIFDQTFQFIGLMEPDGVLVEANRTALEFSGIKESDVLGKPFWEAPWWAHSLILQLKLREAVKTAASGEFVRFEATHPASDGSLHYVDFSIKPVMNESGRVILLIPEGRDITERKIAEEALRIARDELEIQVEARTKELKAANEELKRLSLSDGLTGIANRRYFDDFLEREWNRAKREKTPLSMIMIDIDYFKAFNDTYGHQAGDQCLRTVATVLRTTVKRTVDLVARYGGEEFAIVLPDTDILGAYEVAERIRNNIEILGIEHLKSDNCGFVTISSGIASAIPEKNSVPTEIISEADIALYKAKKEGRNKVRITFKKL